MSMTNRQLCVGYCSFLSNNAFIYVADICSAEDTVDSCPLMSLSYPVPNTSSLITVKLHLTGR